METYIYILGCSDLCYVKSQCKLLPTQFFPSGLISKPALQMHWKLPSVFTQRPFRHITPFTMHSSMSEATGMYLLQLSTRGRWAMKSEYVLTLTMKIH